MKTRARWISVLALIISAVVVAAAKTPSPSPLPSSSPQKSGNPPLTVATPPMPTPTAHPVMSPSEPRIAMVQAPTANQGPPPKPVLYLAGMEGFSTGGKNYIRLRYDVLNKADYPADMFAAAPSLPPCGSNTNASRTWVDFFDGGGRRIYGFCALSKPEDLGKIWIAYEEGTIPPSYVYIELNDRQTNTKYKSNLADTVL
ncbi:MAG: hypothetical protein QOD80_908 [Verrucomicrobiota bacterium]|jgi:hypothetical protein